VYVMVALPSDRVERRLIFVGPIVGGEIIVERGLDIDERIIVHGINKISHGALIDPVSLDEYEAELKEKEAVGSPGAAQTRINGQPDDES